MKNQEVFSKVEVLLNEAIELMDENENVFDIETMDVEVFYQALENLICNIQEFQE